MTLNSGGFKGGNRGANEPPFGLDLVQSIGGGRKFCLGGGDVVLFTQSMREIFEPHPLF